MTPTLSPQQREEVLEAMFRVNHHPLAEASSVELQKLGKALDAALPVIIGAALERAARIKPPISETHSYQAEGYGFGWSQAVRAYSAALRALAAEARS